MNEGGTPGGDETRILVVDDHPDNVEIIDARLSSRGYQIETASNGQEALARVHANPPHLILCDVMMPVMDGYEVSRRVKNDETLPYIPIILVTARDSTQDKVEGLEAGADDYVTKPFAFEELLARVEALGRRPKEIRDPILRVGDLELDNATREVRRAGERIDLTPKEYTVLEYLMRHAGRVMSRTLITEYAWDYHFDPGTNIVDVVINRLRKKVDSGHSQKLVHTVRGVGYVVKA